MAALSTSSDCFHYHFTYRFDIHCKEEFSGHPIDCSQVAIILIISPVLHTGPSKPVLYNTHPFSERHHATQIFILFQKYSMHCEWSVFSPDIISQIK